MHILASSMNQRLGMIIRHRMTLNRSLTIGKNHQVLPAKRKINILEFNNNNKSRCFFNKNLLKTSVFASVRQFSTKKPPVSDDPVE